MITFPLGLKHAPAAVHQPAAWFIPGDNPAKWLEEIALWQVPMEDLLLFVLPRSMKERAPAGVLVQGWRDGKPLRFRRAQPYGCLVGKLYLPVDAMLYPPVSEKELRELLRLDIQILHPTAGLIGFSMTDALRVHDLLTAPTQRSSDWDVAAPGETSNSRLIGVEPLEVPGIDDVFAAARDDIGSDAPQSLAPADDESALKTAVKWLAVPPLAAAALLGIGPLKFFEWLQRKLPKRAPRKPSAGRAQPARSAKAGWFTRMQQRASQNLAKLTQSLLDARSRELDRLQKMLKRNPDEGLRYAIPLRDVGARGRAAPGWRLFRRDINFNLLGLLGGGRAADPWDMSFDLRTSLERQYRDAANRELRLGRYRRAAYIFGELLGDFSAAANALEQGRFYRDAAILYRDHLKNVSKAAECLERGGLLPEAIALYEQLRMFEKAGDLFAQIEQPDQARRCYRLATSAMLNRTDFLGAARLLENKLETPDEALNVLSGAWPDSDAAGTCLAASFQLLGRLARHDETLERIRALRKGAFAPARQPTLTSVLSDVAATYPQDSVRIACADTTRVIAGHQLADPAAIDAAKIANAVARLNPEDRLLGRDVQRFLNRPQSKPVQWQTMRTAQDPAVVRRFELLPGIAWKAAAAEGSGFFAVGVSSEGIVIARGLWDGRIQMVNVGAQTTVRADETWALYPIPQQNEVWFTPPVKYERIFLPPTDSFPARAESRWPSWITPYSLLAAAHNENGLTWVLESSRINQIALKSYRSDSGSIVSSHNVEFAPPADHRFQMVARSEHVCISWGAAVLRLGPVSGLTIHPMPREVKHLAVSAPYTRLRIAAAMEEGGQLLWEKQDKQSFGDGLFDPMIAFTRSGFLVAADARAGRVYRTDGGQARKKGDFAGAGLTAIALTATANLNEFAIFTVDGMVTVYTIPLPL